MFTIGQLATRAQVTTDALRYYERQGLLAPDAKTRSGYRQYGDDALRRIRFIRQAQHCGFSLAEIRELLTLRTSESACCDDVRTVAQRKKRELEAKIDTLRAMSGALDRLIVTCVDGDRPLDDCPILATLENSAGNRE